MSVVRGTALANYPSLVAGLGGDPATLLRAAGVRDQDVGNYDAFISIRAAIRAIESAAAVTATMDFGRRLAQRQGIEILGPVGVAARTAATVGDALAIFNTFMAAYSPVIAIRITPLAGQRSFIALEFLLDEPASYPQTMELALGVAELVLSSSVSSPSVWLPTTNSSPCSESTLRRSGVESPVWHGLMTTTSTSITTFAARRCPRQDESAICSS